MFEVKYFFIIDLKKKKEKKAQILSSGAFLAFRQ